jgi:cholesterol 7-dehydrogenase
MPRWIAKQIVFTLGQFYEQDIMIWQWKTFPSNPALGKEDANIKKYRKWFSQFYSEQSVPFKEALETYSRGKEAVPNW